MLMETHFLASVLASGNHSFPLPQIFFKEFFITASENTFFSLEEKYCFLLTAFFPARGNYRGSKIFQK